MAKFVFMVMVVVGLIGVGVYEYSYYANENDVKNILDNQSKILENQNKILENQAMLHNGQKTIFTASTNGIADLSKKIDILLNIAIQGNSEIKLNN